MVCACVPIEKWGGFTNVMSFDPDLTPDYDTVNRLCVARCTGHLAFFRGQDWG